ncbi:PREDICTED: tRNA pseudouridine(38/39) synthase isoform X1 [Nicrophorus vespilloides]|uniref:tRNA pseudouridine(38/39) synthase isoform X1 n=1 Tax=Nicrophorus vespilloides TaxID=110193 RepID=A0ABM1NAP6_NICVS|nr:PREDICTED: tRNA pseudouridine(38/39) synthase isoform X1 [Nicrophorus vespilloides]
MASVKIKKQNNKDFNLEELKQLTNDQLIEKIKSLQAHNVQLKTLLIKSSTETKTSVNRLKKPFDSSKYLFRHVLLKFFYLGWDYQGFVVQEDTTKTIEHYLFESLTRTCLIKDRESSNYHRCGRTDKGVSSFGQVISIDLRSKLSADNQHDIENELDYCKLLNRVLPDNIQCVAWSPVKSDVSARFDCTGRTYKYFFPKSCLNIEKMSRAANNLLGTHDFRNFCKMDVGNGVVEYIRNILFINISLFDENDTEDNERTMYVITIRGKAFLWHQIRCIMAVLFLIGEGKEEETIIDELLDVNKNSRKPEYFMASEVPLNLFQCDYDIENNWRYDESSLSIVKAKLKSMWTFHNIKGTMILSMLNELDRSCPTDLEIQNYLHLENKTKRYIPLMARKRCESLEEKIKHYVKRSRLEIHNEPESTT